MLRRLFAAAIAVACCSAFTADAQAVYITTNGNLHAYDGATEPLGNVWRVDSGAGNAFANVVLDPVGGGIEVRTVTADFLTGAQQGTFFDVEADTNGDGVGDAAVAAFTAARATIDGDALDIIAGRLFLAIVQPGFDVADPTTWAATFATVFAEFALAPKAAILDGSVVSNPPITGVDGNDSGPGLDESLVNRQTPDANDPDRFFLRVVTLEDSTAAQTAGGGATGNAGDGGDNFLHNVDPTPLGGLVKAGEGFFTDVDTTADRDATRATLFGAGAVAQDAALDGLNLIAAAAGFSTLAGAAPGGNAAAFSTAVGSGQPNEYDPNVAGDIYATFSSESFVINQMVPEPTSMALFGIGAVVCGAFGARRRKQCANCDVTA